MNFSWSNLLVFLSNEHLSNHADLMLKKNYVNIEIAKAIYKIKHTICGA